MGLDPTSVYFLRKGNEFNNFWKDYLSKSKKNVLFVMGLGFDPRCLQCFKILQENLSKSTMKIMVIQYADDFKDKKPLGDSLEFNFKELISILPEKEWISKSIKTIMGTDYTTSVEAVKILTKSEFDGYTDIIIDVSSMPIDVYFPIARTLLEWIDSNQIRQKNGNKLNLHIVVSENASFDAQIVAVGIDDKVTFMHKFGRVLQSEAKKDLKKVWIPLLGENQKNPLIRISQDIAPKEACPVFPMPSKNPYRSTKLLLENRELLFDTLDIDSRNFIYASEDNPFEAFRRIYETAHSYYEAFKPLGGCSVVITPYSSKLFCIGAFLAAHKLLTEGSNAGIAFVENQTYALLGTVNFELVKQNSIPYTMWITGEIYD